MNRAVNLLPESCHNARRRARRRNVWTIFTLSAGLLVIGAWVALCATDRTLSDLNGQFAIAECKQAELERRLTLATKLRDDLVQRARTLAALRQEQPLPAQLLMLTRQAPTGVVFTEISAVTAASGRSAARPFSTRARVVRHGQSGSHPAPPHGPSVTSEPLVVRMSGYAVDHDQLARLIHVLQRVPQWERVELLAAAREPYRTGMALAFELECGSPETSQ
jgi:hypothetical protein